MDHNLYIEYPPYDLGRYRIWIISKMKRQILVNLVYNNRVWSGMKSKISLFLILESLLENKNYPDFLMFLNVRLELILHWMLTKWLCLASYEFLEMRKRI